MSADYGLALTMVKQRLNRAPGDTVLDEYLAHRIEAAAGNLADMGVIIRAGDTQDTMLLVDLAVWQYQNRDQAGAQPLWLRARIRDRWVHERRAADDP